MHRRDHTGLTSRYHGSRGLSRSIMTSSYGSFNSFRAIWARWAYGHPWLVYRVIFGGEVMIKLEVELRLDKVRDIEVSSRCLITHRLIPLFILSLHDSPC